jgi:hypothetical protein
VRWLHGGPVRDCQGHSELHFVCSGSLPRNNRIAGLD